MMRKIKLRNLLACCLLSGSALTSCSVCEEDRTRIGVSSLNANIEKWNQANVTTYVLTYRRGGGLLPPSFINSNRVTVESGVVAQVDVINNEGALVEQIEPDLFADFFTVDGLFAEISALNRSVKDLEVQYDDTIGMPTVITVDPNLGVDGCGDVSDDEYMINAQIEF